MPRVALVTWSGLPELPDDDQLVLEALRARDAKCDAVVWDDASVDFTSYDIVVLRSTWDYHKRFAEFAAWIDRCERDGVKLWNPPRVVRENIHKRYLVELAERGARVVDTALVQAGTPIANVMRERGWDRAVIKPAVSATAFKTFVADATTGAIADDDTLVQPFVAEILTRGEWSLIFLGGAFSHSVLKRPRAGDFRVQNDFGGTAQPIAPSTQLVEDARELLAMIDAPLLYARVDGVERDGRLVLMELELTEPSLFLEADSAARFAEAILSVASASAIISPVQSR